MTRNKWVIVTVAVVGGGFLSVVTLIGLAVYAVASHVDIDQQPDEATVAARFEDIRTRFGGAAPLVILGADGDLVTSPQPADEMSASHAPPETLHVMAWDPDDGGQLFTIRLPFWLLRLGGNHDLGNIDINGQDVPLDLTIDDLDRYGRGLLADYVSADNERLLVWSE